MDILSTLQQQVLTWYVAHKRPLPWRDNPTPYRVWIAEIMLQQTQMNRGVAYFERWMRRFPDIASVAIANEEQILKYWEGLGYYARARNLHQAAKIITQEHNGRFPEEESTLLSLPGIGRYTAGAILCQAFNQNAPIVDANVERVLSRVFDLDQPIKEKDSQAFLWDKAREILPTGHAREFNQALMELGALVCTKNPQCSICPLANLCEARRLNITADRPVRSKRTEITPIIVATGVLEHHGRIFIQKRLPKGAWASLWEFPGGRIEPNETPEQALVREYQEETGFKITIRNPLGVIKHGYTRYRVTLHCFLCTLGTDNTTPTLHAAVEYRWAPLDELDHFAFPAGHRKLIDQLRQEQEG